MEYAEKERKSLYILGWLLLLLAVVCFTLARAWDIRITRLMLPCIFHTVTGLYCPGCGGTRACIAFLHGHFLRSLLYHPVVPYTAVVYLIFMVSHSIELLSKGNFAIGLRYRDNYIKFAAVIILVQWILRNFLKWKWGIDVLGN